MYDPRAVLAGDDQWVWDSAFPYPIGGHINTTILLERASFQCDVQGLGESFADATGSIGLEAAASAFVDEVVVRIPSDYPDLRAAIDRAPPNVRVRLLIQSGHALTKGLFVRDGDFSRFTIASEDDVVSLAPGFDGVTDVGGESTGILILGYNARMPTLGCVIDMGNQHGSGYVSEWGCSGFVLPNCGVINAGRNGLSWHTGHCVAHGTVWSGANYSGIAVKYNGEVAAQAAVCDDCCQVSGDSAVDVSRTSAVHFRWGSAKNSGASGINCRRTSRITFEEADLSGATLDGALIHGASAASGYGANVSGAGRYGISSESMAHVHAMGCDFSGHGGAYGVSVRYGGQIVVSTTVAANVAYNTLTPSGIVFKV